MIPLLAGRLVSQVGILVPDLDEGIARWAAHCAPENWRIAEPRPGPAPGARYRGEPANFAARIGFSTTKPEVELIQSVRGPSIYEDWINERGYGIHHLAVFVVDLEAEVAAMAVAGYSIAQEVRGFGPAADGGYAFFDTVADLGYYLEALRLPS